jgi:eukaryotic-like serine/threonine-protein kinase
MDRAAGTVLAGKYALVSKLGQGGMGAVWRAEHVQLRSPVAIKLIDNQIASNPEALARFMREAQSAAALRSPHVVQILDFGADNGVPYIAMELLEGESLAARIERTRGLTPAETAHIITQVARAVSKAHEGGIVHRDLKPDNIFIVKNDEEEVAKVLDFGIAKASSTFGPTTGSNTRTGAILGTPYYMSPEQAEGNRLVDHRTDLWALGVIAFECLLGRRPFDSEALGSLLLAICTRPIPVPSSLARVPQGFDAWFARACSRELAQRFQSARELAAELRRVCSVSGGALAEPFAGRPSGHPVFSSAATPYVQPQPTANTYSKSIDVEKSKGPIVALVLGGIFGAVVIAGGVAYTMKQRADTAAAETLTEAKESGSGAPTVAASPRPALPEVAPTAIVAPEPSPPAAASASSAPSGGASVRPPVRRPRPTAPKDKAAAPTPTPSPSAPKPTATATAAPKTPAKGVNLGI